MNLSRSGLIFLLANLLGPYLVLGFTVEDVDLHIGTVKGDTSPGPCLPNGSIHPGPDTGASSGNAGFRPNRDIVGFAQLHAQGTGGTSTYGNFLVTPRTGMATSESAHASPASGAVARPHEYLVRLDRWGIDVEVTMTGKVAIYRFTFPESNDARILIDLGRKIGGELSLNDGSVDVNPTSRQISGGGNYRDFWNSTPWIYMCAEVDTTPASHGIWVDGTTYPGTSSFSINSKRRLGGYFQFDTAPGQVVTLKIAVSFESVEKARSYLTTDLPGWDYDAVRDAARDRWNDILGRLEMDGLTAQQRVQLATAWAHCNTQPRDRTGDFAKFPDTAPMYDDHYTLWDTYKTLFPLQTILRPDLVRDVVKSFVTRAQTNSNGYVATAFIGGREALVGQGGNTVDTVVTDAWARGIEGVDWNEVYLEILRHNAENMRTTEYRTLGYVAEGRRGPYSNRMKSGSGTVAFAYEDDCASRVAAALGYDADAAFYAQRSHNWENVFNPNVIDGDHEGFIVPRNLDGSWTNPSQSATWTGGFYEGTPWIYSFQFFHDIDRLVAAMGGREAFISRIEYAFANGLIDFTNEPSFQTPWLPCHPEIDRPDLASRFADQMLGAFPSDDYPGDEDSGAMASLLLFLHAGLYPQVGQDTFFLHGPRVPEVRLNQPDGTTFTLRGIGASSTNRYIQSARLNGRPHTRPWITQSEIREGGELDFQMGPTPNPAAFHAGEPFVEIEKRDNGKVRVYFTGTLEFSTNAESWEPVGDHEESPLEFPLTGERGFYRSVVETVP